MWKIVLLLAIGCVYVASQETTRSPRAREICQRENRKCLSSENRLGRTNDITSVFNRWCRRNNPQWRDITRCQLADATCTLTIVRCGSLSCVNVLGALQSGPTRPGVTTRRPRSTTRRSRTTRRTRTTRRPIPSTESTD